MWAQHCPSQACPWSSGLPHPVPHSLIHQVEEGWRELPGPGAVLGAGEFSGNILSHRLEKKSDVTEVPQIDEC